MLSKIILIIILIIIALLVLNSSFTGFIVKQEDIVSVALESDYYKYYKSQINNVQLEKVVRCECKKLAEKFHWPSADYWYVSFAGDSPILLEFIIADNNIIYKHIGAIPII
jgi:hypothetical protein